MEDNPEMTGPTDTYRIWELIGHSQERRVDDNTSSRTFNDEWRFRSVTRSDGVGAGPDVKTDYWGTVKTTVGMQPPFHKKTTTTAKQKEVPNLLGSNEPETQVETNLEEFPLDKKR